jgi:hypothetical protein
MAWPLRDSWLVRVGVVSIQISANNHRCTRRFGFAVSPDRHTGPTSAVTASLGISLLQEIRDEPLHEASDETNDQNHLPSQDAATEIGISDPEVRTVLVAHLNVFELERLLSLLNLEIPIMGVYGMTLCVADGRVNGDHRWFGYRIGHNISP